jgi:signal transduction histidine kinase/ligand-binding sensor domain-containing protein/CheY-like chemotaxis protein
MTKFARLSFVQCVVLFLFCSPIYADLFDLGSRYFNKVGEGNNGIEPIITSIEQTTDGFLWFGTQGGLVRYDGYRFKKFSNIVDDDTSLSNDRIVALKASNNGNLWIGTKYGGASLYIAEKQSFIQYRHDPEKENSLSHNHVRNIVIDNLGQVWFATFGGVNVLSADLKHFQHLKHDKDNSRSLPSNRVYSIVIDHSANIWIGTDKGLVNYDINNNSFEPFDALDQNKQALGEQTVYRLFLDKQGQVWVGTSKQGAYLVNKKMQLHRIPVISPVKNSIENKWVFGFSQPSESEVWIGTYGAGIYIYDADKKAIVENITYDKASPNSINSNDIGSIYTDQSGMIWIGTWGAGLNSFNSYNEAFRTFSPGSPDTNSITNKNIMSVMENSDGNVWLGTFGNGIDILNPKFGVIDGIRPVAKGEPGIHDGTIMSMFQTDKNTVWIGTRSEGIFKYKVDTGLTTNYNRQSGLPSNFITKIIRASDNRIWVGTKLGLALYRNQSDDFIPVSTTNSLGEPLKMEVLIIQKSKKALWLSTTIGFFRIRDDHSVLEKVKPDNYSDIKQDCPTIMSPVMDNDDQLWIGCKHGLFKVNNQYADLTHFEKIKSIPDAVSVSYSRNILFDQQNNLWQLGAMRSADTGVVTLLSEDNGINVGASWIGSSLRTTNNEIIFGATKGMLAIKPSLFKRWDYQPPVVITTAKVDDKEHIIGPDKTIELGPSNKSFSVEFSALDYSAPTKLKYAVMLEGYDDDWRETSNFYRVANYTNLEPGQYTLKVRGSNTRGDWSPNILTVKIVQIPTWYQTTWFKLLVVIFVALLIFALFEYRTKVLKHRTRVLRQIVRESTRDLEHSFALVKATLDSSVNGILAIDSEGVIERYNHVFANMWGLPKDYKQIEGSEYIFQQMSAMLDDADSFIQTQQMFQDHPTNESHEILFCKNGSVFECFSQPQKIGDKIVGRVWSFFDVTEQKHNEEALRHAKEGAELANQSKSDFIANMSHEIRTPMNGVIGVTDMMLETQLDSTQKRYAMTVKNCGESLLTIINDILDLSKIEAGKIEIETIEFDLYRLLGNFMTTMTLRVDGKPISMECDLSVDVPQFVLGDPTRIIQILGNLVGNAIKFTQQGTIELRCEVITNSSKEKQLKFSVQDSGIGISIANQEKLFKQYSQAERSTTRKYGGTGLGLMISKQLTELMGGDIGVVSSEGQGACFWFTTTFSEAEPDEESGSEKEQNKMLSNARASLQILLIGHPNRAFSTIDAWANKWGIACKHCLPDDDWEQTYRMTTQGSEVGPCIVFIEPIPSSDEHFSWSKKIAQSPTLQDAKIVLIEKNAQQRVTQELKNCGVHELLYQPVGPSSLLDCIDEAVVRKSSDASFESELENANNQQASKCSYKILLAEDNAVNQMVAKSILGKLGYSIDIADNGSKAIDMLSKQKYDLVFMDIRMPILNGLEAAQVIRKEQGINSAIPIVAVTADAMKESYQACVDAGMNDFIVKPIKLEAIKEKLDKWLKS